ncbi:hypothetical protein GQ44DRAFT_713505 [Phaeosphaeriaceae sp. PMI808]|nr:hypothetical protein GQ44DRAFT_713505 [Phaeosphaeriaceae sp. PMI808]
MEYVLASGRVEPVFNLTRYYRFFGWLDIPQQGRFSDPKVDFTRLLLIQGLRVRKYSLVLPSGTTVPVGFAAHLLLVSTLIGRVYEILYVSNAVISAPGPQCQKQGTLKSMDCPEAYRQLGTFESLLLFLHIVAYQFMSSYSTMTCKSRRARQWGCSPRTLNN